MSNPVPPPLPRGIDYDLPTCGDTLCNSQGTCARPHGGGTDFVCDCKLGYQGEHCEDTVNGALNIPLTLSVLAVIFGLLIFAFIFAKLRQRQKKRQRRHLAEKHGYNIAL
ncbi:sushi, von Willebrand factor type A, EGF and pentraxin domain-containing protein 1-like [Morone saxatilis]|uniref:sushi, von Willebrand factor type A, EGF and pentraxin domain-containing protein 1-like n=1 Tax=Morone saxatilis TaxID=34816 RepID=UPI0015E2383D|nr:sushi, von Willebrand factor type A, EGF and pentraxin domain-containing protein 1-like [Morone saxatilis]